MDIFSATLCSAQALAYALTVVKTLTECHLALRHGCGFLCDQQASVGHLQQVLIQLKSRTRLDPSLRSLLESINTTVRGLLLLVKQRKRRQLLVLLVIRRTEVNESFALLERKKSTLNLYLTTQNSFAIASIKTVILSGSAQDFEMAEPAQKICEYNRGSEEKESIMSADASVAQALQSRSSNTPRFTTIGNVASGKGVQTICGPTHQCLDVRHAGNEMNGNATQFIGAVEHGQNQDPEDVRKELGLGENLHFYHTFKNTVQDGAQNIFAPRQQISDIKHEGNIAENHAIQNIGTDPHRVRWWKAFLRISKKSKA